jgi:NAD(P)-dependent dehydrogenase (short-subunit alcohol dehydrogenase family)
VKSGLIGLTRYTSTYWPENVRCNCLCPGGVYNNQSPIFLDKVKNEIPMSRLANVNEYGGVIVYLLSEASSYMNGSVIPIDGGRTTW